MTVTRFHAALLTAGIGLLAPAEAQTTRTRTETVAPGKAVRLVIAANLTKDCSSGPMPEIKISTAPKNGEVVTKAGRVKTPAAYRCPNKEAQVQAVFYKSKAGFSGTDEVLVEIKTADGTVEKQDIRITVDAAAKKDDAKSKDKSGGTDL